MFILDTNILSEMMRAHTVSEVAAWVSVQNEKLLFTTTICHAEIFSGLAIMPQGRRRRNLEIQAHAMFDEFSGRVLPFTMEAATAYASLFALRRRSGHPSKTHDLMIAAIAQSYGATLVTRNAKDFKGCGISIINPWKS